ncbi:hypothetical protein [Amycolatopsis sp. cmx-4-61]|uniref:hypothetical protein n=1 Tax=Amycolatopsis sp. cmx-4-61 TaxID=2790937 RepID=UPI003979236B
MGSMSSAPWTVVLGYSHPLAFALAVRDALDIPCVLGIPPVLQPPALAAPGVPADRLPALWQEWWEDTVTLTRQDAPSIPLSPSGPLAPVVEDNRETLHRWSSGHKREVARASNPFTNAPRMRDAVHEHERKTGTRIGGFRLQVTALPVAGELFLPTANLHVMVSLDLLRNRQEYVRRVIAHVTS